MLVAMLLALSSLILYNAAALWTWLRAVWILRPLPNGSGNLIYGGLQKVLAFNRMREVQKMNEAVLHGAGACKFNVLWRQVAMLSCFALTFSKSQQSGLACSVWPHLTDNSGVTVCSSLSSPTLA